jgi:hypothetical protein
VLGVIVCACNPTNHEITRVHARPVLPTIAIDTGEHPLGLGGWRLVNRSVIWRDGILVAHGKQDNVYSVLGSRYFIVPHLRHAGYEVSYLEFDGPHWLPVPIARKVLEWLMQWRGEASRSLLRSSPPGIRYVLSRQPPNKKPIDRPSWPKIGQAARPCAARQTQ